MSIGRKSLLQWLLVAAATVTIVYLLSYVPLMRNRYLYWLKVKEIVYVPHKAPDSAVLGAYEQVSGPYSAPWNATTDVLVESHGFDIDMKEHKYHSYTNGYLHKKDRDGNYYDQKVEILETYDYDTLHTRYPAERPIPIAAASLAESRRVPDSVHLPSKKQEEEVRTFWKQMRHRKLPYRYMVGGNMQITVTSRRVAIEMAHDTIYLKTLLKCFASYPGTKSPSEPMEMEAREPIE